MSSKYYVWKDPACAGVNIEWLKVSTEEFFGLLKRSKSEHRHFIRLGNDICTDADIIYIEATEEQYRDWRSERNNSDYLFRLGREIPVVSMDSPMPDEELVSMHEAIKDDNTDVEESALSHVTHEWLEQILKTWSVDDARLLVDMYIHCKNADEIARERGVHRSTIYRQVAALSKRLKKFF